MTRLALAMLLSCSALGCFGFDRRVAACFDGGVCTVGVPADDAGQLTRDAAAPFDAGFVCRDGWCWENPFPHGSRLTTAFLEGTDLVVAGEDGVLLERRAGEWRSFNTLVPTVNWVTLWGRTLEDLWLTGDTRVWRRRQSQWQPAGEPFFAANPGALVGTPTDVYVGVADTAYGWNELGERWDERQSFRDGGPDVLALTIAFDGGVYALVRRSIDMTMTVATLDGSPAKTWPAGLTGLLYGTRSALYLAGTPTRRLDAALNETSVDPVQVVAETATGLVLAADATRVGVLTEQGRFVGRAPARDVRAIATSGARAVAVGDDGLLVEFDGSQWLDAGVRETSPIVAFVELEGVLHAVTGSCDVLRRGPDRWRRVAGRPNSGCLGAVARGTFLELLVTDGSVVTLDATASFGVSAQTGSLAPDVRRLWQTPANALVVTSRQGVFVRAAPGGEFRLVSPEPAFGITGRGELVRLCDPSTNTVSELDLADPSATRRPVPGVFVTDCRALVALSDGRWAYGSRGAQDVLHLVIEGSPAVDVRAPTLTGTLEALVEVDGGVALCAEDMAIVSTVRPVAPLANEPLPMRRQLLTGTTWRGRLFVGSFGGAILERAAP